MQASLGNLNLVLEGKSVIPYLQHEMVSLFLTMSFSSDSIVVIINHVSGSR